MLLSSHMTVNYRPVLREMVDEWAERDFPKIIPRGFYLENWLSGPVHKIVSVVGFRRVGKTFILLETAQKLGKDKCLYLNLEDERLPQKTEVLTQLLEVLREKTNWQPEVLFLDEIQNIPDWSRWAQRVNEEGKYRLVLSGSSSKLSSAEIPTELRGRTVTKTVFPLSFSEFLKFKGNSLTQYLTFGGFPEVVLSDEGKRYLLLDEYYQTFVVRDLLERYRPREEEALRDLMRLLLNAPFYTIGKLTASLNSSGKYHLGKSTVGRYVSWLKESFFLHELEIHTAKIKARLQHPKKAYFVDNFFVSRLTENFSANLGRLMEQAVALQLFRQKSVDSQTEIFYWRDPRDREVDFVVRKNLEVKSLLQVCYVSRMEDLPERETVSLLRAGKELSCKNMTIITFDLAGEKRIDGEIIKLIPLNDFLLK